MAWHSPILTVVVLAGLGASAPTDACPNDPSRTAPYWRQRTITVQVMTTGSGNVDLLEGVTSHDVVLAVRRAITEYNEHGGAANVRLVYDSSPADLTKTNNIVVLRDPSAPVGDDWAYWSSRGVDDEGYYLRGAIALHHLTRTRIIRTWWHEFLLRTLIHELGHGLGLNHGRENCLPGLSIPDTVMNCCGLWALPRYDKLWHQAVYGTRAGLTPLHFKTKDHGGQFFRWQPVADSPRNEPGDWILYRPGAGSQNFFWQAIAWIQGPLWRLDPLLAPHQPPFARPNEQDMVVQQNNALKVVRIVEDFDATFDESLFPTSSSVAPSSPVAVAIATDHQDAALVYGGHEKLTDGRKRVCVRRSDDNGLSFSDDDGEFCIGTFNNSGFYGSPFDPPVDESDYLCQDLR